MTHDPAAEWQIEPVDRPAQGREVDRLRFLLRYAILAPSGHNTQPWLFRVRGDRIELLADRTRSLPVVDPRDRALIISCGPALGSLRAAMRHFGHAGRIELLLAGNDRDLLARVGFGASHAPSPAENARFQATTRRAFAEEPMPCGLGSEIEALARADEVTIAVIAEPSAKARIATLVAEGDRVQFADPRFRRELGDWVHSRRAATRDGLSGAAFGMPDALSPVGGLVIRTFDLGDGIAAKDEQIATGSPALLVVATPGDGPRDWLLAGMAHMEALLAVTAVGLTAAYLNQPVEVEDLRPRLRDVAGVDGHPQLLLRIGQAPEIPPAVRRPVEEVLID
ncbi:Acg family FMN-binding oxidoreductase [Rubellimicrobium roseum]|uniref:Nitroreductase n=1 Tax=Rubellimicrobium roseum TaxID=687525 RepID=A0A5C4N7K7_9RHOB|nr:nitroreductase [Rubellimicrobium roseum]TNC62553.1 nitroreductase [Rubellimicrobium roseum]